MHVNVANTKNYIISYTQLCVFTCLDNDTPRVILSVWNFSNYFGLWNMENISSPISPSYACVFDFIASCFLSDCYMLLLHNDLWARGIFSIAYSHLHNRMKYSLSQETEGGMEGRGKEIGQKEYFLSNSKLCKPYFFLL